MPKTKSFRVAVEGATVDGRTIERSWLTEAAASYNPATYAARVNMEHIRGITADKPFKAYGDVTALEAREIDLELDGKTTKKMALFATVEATDELIAINRDNQKLYTSIEINPNFAETKKAYLVGLAVTDSPASLGTERMTFAIKHPGVTKLQPTPQAAGNIFSLGLETKFDLDGPAPADTAGLLDTIKAGFATLALSFTRSEPEPKPEPKTEPKTPANDNDFAAFATAMGNQVASAIGAAIKPTNDAVAALTAKLATVEASIETIDSNPKRRSLSIGPAAGVIQADF